jgi:plasmid stabilization system protein ParE
MLLAAIREEVERAFMLLAARPRVGVLARNERLPDVRRVFLARVRYHLYYAIFDSDQSVRVLAFWHASRGVGPQIEKEALG